MKYGHFNPSTLQVMNWLDTEQFNIVLPDNVIPLTEEQWLQSNKPCWVNLTTKELVTTPPPGEFYRLDGDEWIFDAARYNGALSSMKARFEQAIKTRRDEATADYIVIEGNHFHSDANSRIQQMSLTKMGQAKQIPANLMWQTKNNGLIPLTNEIAAQFEMVTMDHDMRLFANAQRHLAAVEAITDIQTLQDYDYTAGWQP